MSTNENEDIDATLAELYQRGFKCAAAGYISKDDEKHAIREAKASLERLQEKQVVLARIEECKAYGGCTVCYGKGYATWRHGETYRGSTHNMRNEVKYCECDRGKQLERLMKQEAHRTTTGWCCACDNDLAWLEHEVETKVNQRVIEELNALQKHHQDMGGYLLLFIEERLAELQRQQDIKETTS